MARGAAGRRYAKALFQLASETSQVAQVRGELDALAALFAESPELAAVLLQPLRPVAERRKVLDAGAEFARLADEQAGVRRAQVRTARPLSDAQLERLRRALAARLGHEVQIEVEVDPELLGGLVAQVGDLLLDGSVRTQLRQLRASLATGH